MSLDDERRYKGVVKKRNEVQKLESRVKLNFVVTRAFLAIWLSIIVLISLYFVYQDYSRILTGGNSDQDTPPYVISTALLVAVGHLVGAVGLLNWRMWGFYCIAGATALMLIVNAVNGVSWLELPTGLLNVGVVYFLLKSGAPECIWRYLK